MFLELPFHLLLIVLTLFGLAWPWAARLRLAAAEQVLASVALSLLGLFLLGWCVYVFGLPWSALWLGPALALVGMASNARAIVALFRDGGARDLSGAQLLVMAWCLGWLLFVASYSGGGWAGDWVEHWERARFFLERWPQDSMLLGIYSLTARPPLANVVTASLLQLTRADFVHFQIISTVLSSLAFLPAALLARRFGGVRSIAVLAVLFMLNPLFVQNATFPWTKLPAAFFVLTGWYFLLRSQDEDAPAAAAPLFATSLAAGVLTHYSSVPYALVLGVAWVVLRRKTRSGIHPSAPLWRIVLIAAAVSATWFAWAFATYGVRGTLSANTSVAAARRSTGALLESTLLNFRDTLVPHFLRSVDSAFIAQPDRWGAVRDWWFQLYQLNLFFAFGCAGWLVLLVTLRRRARETAAAGRLFWLVTLGGVFVLGIAVHTPRDTWGLMHICLQPLVLLGLAFLAAQWARLNIAWKIVLLAGAVVDFALGIALHFAVQNDLLKVGAQQYNGAASINYAAKIAHRLEFFHDRLAPPVLAIALFLGALLAVAGFRVWRESRGRGSEASL